MAYKDYKEGVNLARINYIQKTKTQNTLLKISKAMKLGFNF